MPAVETPIASTPKRGFFSALADGIASFGAMVMQQITSFGDILIFFGQTLSWIVIRWPSRTLLVQSLYQIGVRSLPVVALTGVFIGMVLAVQAYFQFNRFGMATRLGVMINLSMYRELGPVLAATMLAGRVGSSIAAEIGTMRVTEQIDALESMGANAIQHLVAPRFLACLFMIPSLTIMAMFMGVVGGAFYCIYIYDVDPYFYFVNSQEHTSAWDLIYGVIKSIFFGAAMSIISCYRGFHSEAGAEGVGRAATIAFVQSFVVILIFDLLLSVSLDELYQFLWPGEDF
jgi:phospholipid/cholesterol/gamma-HCH transport system permease protein